MSEIKTRTGWIKSIRTQKHFTFISCTDGRDSEFQITLPKDLIVDGELKDGASFNCEGEDSITPRGSYEFKATAFKIVGPSDETYPIQPKEHSKEFLRTIPQHRGRTRELQATWKIRSLVSQEIHNFFARKGFYQYFAPIITKSDCEGAGQTFKVKSDWMDDAHLTVSAQLEGEVGMMSLGKVYVFGPCFRAEKSATRKHLSEFWMLEPEMAFYDLEKTMDLAEELVKRLISTVQIYYPDDLKMLDWQDDTAETIAFKRIAGYNWKRVTYDEIAKEFGISYGQDINAETEKLIADKYGPTFVTHYPADLKPFYMKKKDGKAMCFDLIFPEVGELIGGSEREEDYEILKTEMEKSGLDMSKMQWYLDTRKYGTVPHAGFGLGIERLIMYITKAEKVHDTIPFPVSF